MDDVALHKRFAERRKPRFHVEADRVVLRVERRQRIAASARVRDEAVEQPPAHPASARGRQHRHAADLGRAAEAAVIASRRDDDAAFTKHGMARGSIRPVVLVDFFFGRHTLLVDEDGEAHGQRLRDAHAIRNVEEFGRRKRSAVRRIHLCTGLLERNGRILLVANAYPNQPALLWNLPGGRQEGRETCAHAVVREVREETGLDARVTGLAYVAESFDPATATQFTAFCFTIEATGEPYVPAGDAHVRDCRWIARTDLAATLEVRVVREPLLAYLADPTQRYFGYLDAGITIAFADDPVPPDGATPRA